MSFIKYLKENEETIPLDEIVWGFMGQIKPYINEFVGDLKQTIKDQYLNEIVIRRTIETALNKYLEQYK